MHKRKCVTMFKKKNDWFHQILTLHVDLDDQIVYFNIMNVIANYNCI